MRIVQIIAAILILCVAIFVALSPAVVYAPTPRVVLFFIVSFLPALIFGIEVAARLEFKLPGIVFTTAGAFAACLGALLIMNHIAKPEEKIAVFQIFDAAGQPVNLDASSAFEVPLTSSGLSITRFVDRNTVVLIFPEQVASAELRVRPNGFGPIFSGDVTYAGSRTAKLTLGKQLTKNPNAP